MQETRNPQNTLFQVLDQIPNQLWYTLAVGSILTSLVFQLMGKKNWADFIGKWPPTFFAVGLYHALVRPGREDAMAEMQSAIEDLRERMMRSA